MSKLKLKFSCVLDESPLMAVQSYIWLNSLLFKSIPPNDIYIHLVGKIPFEYLNYLKEKGINVIEKTPFDVRNKYCNKLVQLSTFEKEENYDYVFLMDCDTALVSLDGLELSEDIYAKIVDFPNPPLQILKKIFANEGFDVDETKASFSNNNERITDWNNCNGGVYIVNKDFLQFLAPEWKKYALKCIEGKENFTASYEKHADQVGFALAMNCLKKKVSHLNIAWNFPIHVEAKNLEVDAKILHFHDRINDQINLSFTSNESINIKIHQVNSIISKSIRKYHLNSIFWEFRYQFFPDLGSGIGSRGKTLLYKRELLKKCLPETERYSILDVGCGDLEVMREFPFSDYLGLDLSQESLEIAKSKRPDWSFGIVNQTNNFQERDIVICLDVLIHQNSFLKYKELIEFLVSHTTHRLIVAAYDRKPEVSSDITFYYEPISISLKCTEKFKNITRIGEYRSTSFYVADTHISNLEKPKSILHKILKYIT